MVAIDVENVSRIYQKYSARHRFQTFKSSIVRGDIFKALKPDELVTALDEVSAWNAGLLVGLIKNWDLNKCIKVANAMGALVVTRRGAITALPNREELLKFLKKAKIEIKI